MSFEAVNRFFSEPCPVLHPALLRGRWSLVSQMRYRNGQWDPLADAQSFYPIWEFRKKGVFLLHHDSRRTDRCTYRYHPETGEIFIRFLLPWPTGVLEPNCEVYFRIVEYFGIYMQLLSEEQGGPEAEPHPLLRVFMLYTRPVSFWRYLWSGFSVTQKR